MECGGEAVLGRGIGQGVDMGGPGQFKPATGERIGDPVRVFTQKPQRPKFGHPVAGPGDGIKISLGGDRIAVGIEHSPGTRGVSKFHGMASLQRPGSG